MHRLIGGLIVATAIAAACNYQGRRTGPNPVAGPSPIQTAFTASAGFSHPQAVSFPPRNEPFDFRNQLEVKYRDGMGRGSNTSFVDTEGDIVWITEYLRYRVNGCDHATALQKVMAQIDGGGVQAVCREVSASGSVAFPPRNEPFDFRNQLEAKYRDGLRRTAGLTFVDIEGDIVWISEYLRYRLNGCDHVSAVQNTLVQIDGRPAPPICATTGPGPTPAPTPAPPPSPTPAPTPSPSPSPSPTPSPPPPPTPSPYGLPPRRPIGNI